MSDNQYLNFDILIEPTGTGGYRARIVDSPAGQLSRDFTQPFSDVELENFVLKAGKTHRGVRGMQSPEVEAAKTYGGRLFKSLFSDEALACLQQSIDDASEQNAGLRIRLNLTNAPELAGLPWEFLYNPVKNRFLAVSNKTPIVRYLELSERIRPLKLKSPLKILVVISSPSDYPPLDVEHEWNNLKSALSDLEERGLVVLQRLPTADPVALQHELRREQYHVFHFIGHGGFDPAAQDGVLILEGENRRGVPMSGQYLGAILHDEDTLRLAVLNACEGGRSGATDPFSGVAQSLIQQGVPAVIAMQFEISDDAAITFGHEFYIAIAEGLPIDAALGEARKTIYSKGNGFEWGTPVLYMRSADGMIFHIEKSEQAPLPASNPINAAPLPAAPSPVKMPEATAVRSLVVEPAKMEQALLPSQPPDASIKKPFVFKPWMALSLVLFVVVGIIAGAGWLKGRSGNSPPKLTPTSVQAVAFIQPSETPILPEPTQSGVLLPQTGQDLPSSTPEPTLTLTPEPPTATTAPTETQESLPTTTFTPAAPLTPTPLPAALTDRSGAAMVLVPAGPFRMGYDYGQNSERPVHTVNLGSFYIDQFEVTNAQYSACVEDGACSAPGSRVSASRGRYYDTEQFASFPVISVSWQDAVKFCEWRGARLPSEAEWEKAARGTGKGLYPWGDELKCDYANYTGCSSDTTAVGSYPEGSSEYGALDMAGNVWEWVGDWFDPKYYGDPSAKDAPAGPVNGTQRVLRGGSWNDTWGKRGDTSRVSYRNAFPPNYRSVTIGFRCAVSSGE